MHHYLCSLDISPTQSYSTKTLDLAAPRPAYSVLGSERGILRSDLDGAIDRYLQECNQFR